MADIYWLEQNESDLPAENDWLSSNELLRLRSFRFPKRHADWRLGRWTAKQALARCFNVADEHKELARIELCAALSGAPGAFIDGQVSNFTISLSHSSGRAAAAAAPGNIALGCDLELIEPHSNAFVSDYFTDQEQELMRRSSKPDRPALATLIWSAKESALKSLHAGLRLDTRSVSVSINDLNPSQDEWRSLQVHTNDQLFHGWWRKADNFIQTVVADPAPSAPVLLESRVPSLASAWQ